jgi:uncharacterized RDD family membrane protein YckC
MIRVTNGTAEIEDVGSRNGTWINDVRVLTGLIKQNDRIKIGDSIFLVQSTGEDHPHPTPTPPAPPTTQYAGFWVRVAAKAIDTVVVTIPLMLLSYLITWMAPNILVSFAMKPVPWSVVTCIFVYLVFGAYFVYMEGNYGQSLGRMATRIKVEQVNGGQMDYGLAVTRLLICWGLTTAIPVIGLAISTYLSRAAIMKFDINSIPFGGFIALLTIAYVIYYYIMLASNSRKYAWHDILAETRVVALTDWK